MEPRLDRIVEHWKRNKANRKAVVSYQQLAIEIGGKQCFEKLI